MNAQYIPKGAAAQWLAKEYGGYCEVVRTLVPVATTQTQIMANDPDCLVVYITNSSIVNTLFLGLNEDVGQNYSRHVKPEQTVTYNVRDDGIMPTLPMYGVGTAACQLEIVRVRRVNTLPKDVIDAMP